MLLNLDNLPKKGESVTFKTRGATFQMVIENARIRYGKIDVLVSPVAGTGSFWVRYDNLKGTTTLGDTVEDTLDKINACGVAE